MMTADFLRSKLKNNEKLTVYTPDNIPLIIEKEPCIELQSRTIRFEADCKELSDYCNALGLQINPTNNI